MGLFYNFSVCLFSALGSCALQVLTLYPRFAQVLVWIFAGGCFFGAAAAGSLATRIGRKRTIQLGAVVAILGCSLQTGAQNVSYLIVGRLIAGLAIGWTVLSMVCPVVPLYQSEISPPEIRGFLTGWTQFMISHRFLVAGCTSTPILRVHNIILSRGRLWLSISTERWREWRVALAIQVFPATLLFLGMFILPYSPRWLVEQGRNDEAFAIVQRLHDAKDNEGKEQIRYEQKLFHKVLRLVVHETDAAAHAYRNGRTSVHPVHRDQRFLLLPTN
ncbi:hypothetical protein B0H14DRAFT_2630275, partial [Mycena olivaceomarginata]